MSGSIPYLDAAAVRAALAPAGAAAAITRALLDGFDPAAAVPRAVVDLAHGQLLLMPGEAAGAVGVKVATVAPDNPARGLPRVHAVYLHLDATTLVPHALLDGTALTTLRTPAVSAAALAPVAHRLLGRPVDVVVLGAGPQATGHVEALAALDGVELGEVSFVVRRPDGVDRALTEGSRLLAADDAAVGTALAEAGVVVCATSARGPVLDSRRLRDDALVVAVGSHEPDVRELDSALMARATVVVEDVATALREAGDVVLAIADGSLDAGGLVPLAAFVRGEVSADPGRPVVFKSSGMAWEDVVVADAVLAAWGDP